MLVLSRKAGEKLMIGDNIAVEVVRISGNRITLGIVAPADVKILRGELSPFKEPTGESVAEGADEYTSSQLLRAS